MGTKLFQSTHSLRSATGSHVGTVVVQSVSIHALLAECDGGVLNCTVLAVQFQSTHSLRSATHDRRLGDVNYLVSIHALLAECDSCLFHRHLPVRRFNPRTPCGVRPLFPTPYASHWRFQSTHSLRSATDADIKIRAYIDSFNPRTPCGVRLGLTFKSGLTIFVSIHALLAECDDG